MDPTYEAPVIRLPRPVEALRLLAIALAAALVSTGCQEAPDPGPVDPPDVEPVPPEPGPEPEPDPPEVEPLPGDPTTEDREATGEPDTQFVHDVRVGTHDGFDRVVVDLAGDAVAGWRTAYVDDARARQALGVVEPGDAVLEITIRDITPPDERTEELQVWDEGPIEGPANGVVEQVDAATTNGEHVVVVGLPEELPYLAALADAPPGTLIVDIFHE